MDEVGEGGAKKWALSYVSTKPCALPAQRLLQIDQPQNKSYVKNNINLPNHAVGSIKKEIGFYVPQHPPTRRYAVTFSRIMMDGILKQKPIQISRRCMYKGWNKWWEHTPNTEMTSKFASAAAAATKTQPDKLITCIRIGIPYRYAGRVIGHYRLCIPRWRQPGSMQKLSSLTMKTLRGSFSKISR